MQNECKHGLNRAMVCSECLTESLTFDVIDDLKKAKALLIKSVEVLQRYSDNDLMGVDADVMMDEINNFLGNGCQHKNTWSPNIEIPQCDLVSKCSDCGLYKNKAGDWIEHK